MRSKIFNDGSFGVRHNIDLYMVFSAIVILFSSWTIYYHLPYAIYFYMIFVVWTINKYNHIASDRLKIFSTFYILAVWFYLPFDFNIKNILIGVIYSISISLIFLIDKKTLYGILEYIFNTLSWIVAFGLIAHLLRITNIYHFPEITTVMHGLDREYSVYLLHVYEILPGDFLMDIRFSSIFDEPGYLGTITAFYLITQDLDLKKIPNLILFIGGVFTLSLAYYIIIIPFIVIKFYKNPKVFDLIVIVFTLLLVINSFMDIFNAFFLRQEFVNQRLTSSRGDMSTVINNVAVLMDQSYINILFGNGNSYNAPVRSADSYKLAGSDIFRLFYQIGIFGVIYLFVFVVKNVKKDIQGSYFIFIFIFSLFQRPQIFEMIYILLLAVNMKSVASGHNSNNNEISMV
jgi:hypothetical protein